ncbi:MAG TPA: beta-propeller domain-containing protein, partial [Acidimicrobiales bacterium]|nr:beta-propeller domain-containing protein [Acidimicrobiales bacterium]
MAGLAALLGTGSLLAGCAGGPARGEHQGGTPAAARLVSYDSCPQFLDQVRAQALAEVGPYGLSSSGSNVSGSGERMALDAPQAAAAATPSAGTASSGAAASTDSTPSFSSTNVQEAGVDEPDLAKTDGNLLVALRRNDSSLQVAEVGATPKLRGSLPLSSVVEATGLFLVGTDAVVLGAAPQSAPVPQPLSGTTSNSSSSSSGSDGLTAPIESYTPSTVVAVVSLADPDHPAVVRTFDVQGTEVDARLIAGHIEVVVTSAPTLPFVAPSSSSAPAQAAALADNKAIIQMSQPSDWLPSVTSEPSGVSQTTACTAAMHPVVASGLGTVSVVPIDPSATQPGPEATIVGDASTVYASATSLYVATTAWTAPSSPPVATGAPSATGIAAPVPVPSEQPPASTDIHGFDLANPGAPVYVGSAEVDGTLIGQYAMSEYEGYLRVATTVGSATPPPNEGVAPTTASDNRVTILQPQGGSLVTVGTVSGLGSGEKIYAVRFIGPLGYVVTFRQTDPLYVLDLHDPHSPQLAGQLELTGYSSFLQPVGNNL